MSQALACCQQVLLTRLLGVEMRSKEQPGWKWAKGRCCIYLFARASFSSEVGLQSFSPTSHYCLSTKARCIYNNPSNSGIDSHDWSRLVISFIPPPPTQFDKVFRVTAIATGRIWRCSAAGSSYVRASSSWVAYHCWNIMKNANTDSLQREERSREGWSQEGETEREREERKRAIFSLKTSEEGKDIQ